MSGFVGHWRDLEKYGLFDIAPKRQQSEDLSTIGRLRIDFSKIHPPHPQVHGVINYFNMETIVPSLNPSPPIKNTPIACFFGRHVCNLLISLPSPFKDLFSH